MGNHEPAPEKWFLTPFSVQYRDGRVIADFAEFDQSGEPGKSTWVRYPNGDGFLVYPGKPIGFSGLVSSIRLEQAREGVEDFKYLYLLRELSARAKASGRDAREAGRVLAEAGRLVEIPNAGGRYSSQILPDPDAVLRLKWAAGAAIEQLSGKGR